MQGCCALRLRCSGEILLAAARASEISALMMVVHRVPVGHRHGRASCFRRTTYDTTVTTCRAVLRSHLGFGSLDAVRVVRVVTHIHGGAPTGLFELDEFGAHLCTFPRPLRLFTETNCPTRQSRTTLPRL